jgi:hypothetical protein
MTRVISPCTFLFLAKFEQVSSKKQIKCKKTTKMSSETEHFDSLVSDFADVLIEIQQESKVQQIDGCKQESEGQQIENYKQKRTAGGANTNLYGKRFEIKTNNEPYLLEMGFIKQSIQQKKKTNKKQSVKDIQITQHKENPQKQGKYKHCLVKKFDDNRTITFVSQSGLKAFAKAKFNVELYRLPDEAYIIEQAGQKTIIKILEKKAQNIDGSVETKLWSGPSLKREYEIIFGEDYIVEYGFCLSNFLKAKLTSNEKKYKILKQILGENKIAVLYGDDDDYFESLNQWLGLERDS